jgi:hypothetical protein
MRTSRGAAWTGGFPAAFASDPRVIAWNIAGCCRHLADAVTFPLTATDTLKRVPITAAFTQKKWIFGPAIRSARNRG